MSGTRKILILGNGFDLAHFLPTKYDHFIHAMRVIEDSEDKAELSFDQLFESLIEKEKHNLEEATTKIEDSDIEKELKKKEVDQLIENYFFHCTTKLYKTSEVKLTINEVVYLKERLVNNGWYQYFKHYIDSGIETWIDFENEMVIVLKSLCYIFDTLNENPNQFSWVQHGKNPYIGYFNIQVSRNKSYIHHPFLEKILTFFSISLNRQEDKDKIFIESKFIKHINKVPFRLDEANIFKSLENQLNEFIEIFSIYIQFIERLEPEKTLNLPLVLKDKLEAIYSFNYSSTVKHLYNKIDIHYLHGKAGEKERNKIVLGVSDLEHELLKENKSYGFVKYYQKLVNNTDYQFLKPKSLITEIESRKIQGEEKIDFWHPIEIYIWGHSLDSSDKDYIEEIFSFNQGKKPSIRVIVYFYSSPHQQLANLISILGKDIIESWMKNDWLEFIKMPNIYKLNFEESYSDNLSNFCSTIKGPIDKRKQSYGLEGKRIF